MYTECSDMFLYTAMYNLKESDKEKYKEFKREFIGDKNLISVTKLMILNNLINRFCVKDELILYRGTKDSYFRRTSRIEGNMVTLIPIISTSLDKKTAYNYIPSSDPLLLEIHIPKKFPALWLKPFSAYPMECEFLLGCNSLFKIEEVSSEVAPYTETKKIVLKGIVNGK